MRSPQRLAARPWPGLLFGLVCALVPAAAAAAGPASLAPRAGAVEADSRAAAAAAELHTLLYREPVRGFIEDAIWSDGVRFAYLLTDASTFVELRVVTLATGAERAIALPLTLLAPTEVALFGETAVVLARSENSAVFAHWVDLTAAQAVSDVASPMITDAEPSSTKSPLKGSSFIALKRQPISPSAREAAFCTWRGKPCVVLYDVIERAQVKPARQREHRVTVLDAYTGKRLLAPRSLYTNLANYSVEHEFTVNHWDLPGLTAQGTKAGEYLRKEDLRLPDRVGIYHVLDGKFDTRPITDPRSHQTWLAGLAERYRTQFARFASNQRSVEIWLDGMLQPEPTGIAIGPYRRDYVGFAAAPAQGWLGLQIEPDNAAAIAARRLDVEWFDIYRVQQGAATRVARVPAAGKRFVMGAVGVAAVWLLDRNRGFSRGGKSLRVVRLPQP